jgi:hypothetical protein
MSYIIPSTHLPSSSSSSSSSKFSDPLLESLLALFVNTSAYGEWPCDLVVMIKDYITTSSHLLIIGRRKFDEHHAILHAIATDATWMIDDQRHRIIQIRYDVPMVVTSKKTINRPYHPC